MSRRLLDHLLEHGKGAKTAHVEFLQPPLPLTERDLERIYCEWMVLDGYRNPTGDEKFFSADLRQVLMLDRNAWDVSAEAAKKQEQGFNNLFARGAKVPVTGESRLCLNNALVSLQGAFVNDRKHGFLVEIHPLNSLAYAVDAQGLRYCASDRTTRAGRPGC